MIDGHYTHFAKGRSIVERLTRHCNALSLRMASLAYVVVLLLAVGFRRFIIDFHDPYKCRALMNDGNWYHDHTWLTPGCVTEPYGTRAITDCLSKRRVVFAGDSQMRSTYWNMVQKLDHEIVPEHAPFHNMHFSKDGVDIESLWDPHLNSTELYQAVDSYRERDSDAPALIVLGLNNWYAENNATYNFTATMANIATIARSKDSGQENGLEAFSAHDGPGDLLLIAPVQEPYHDTTTTKPESISQALNAHLRLISEVHGFNVLWSFNKMTAGRRDKYLNDEWNAQWDVLRKRVDIILGLRCNAKAAQNGHFPNTKVCCANWSTRTWVQSVFLALGLVLLPTIVLVDYRFAVLSSGSRTLLRALSAFSAVISLQYVADRTHIFEQVQRLPLSLPNLHGMLAIAFLVGAITVRRSTPATRSKLDGQQPSHPFLARDQSDEMKGYLQLLIIIYHYNMAWTADWYWEIIRLAVATYLFLTGFGHAVYFLQKGDYSFRRVCAVILRTNLLPCTLAYVMRTRWLLYYYMPLSTFWFLIIYATMAIGSKRNYSTVFVLAKIVVSAAGVYVFISTRDLSETVTRLFAITCRISFDANAFFHYRVRIDLFIVYVGIIVALIYVRIGGIYAVDAGHGIAARHFRRIFKGMKLSIIVISTAALPGFFFLKHKHIHSQSDWTALQPYITLIPILSLLVLRNAHPAFRAFHSTAFAWLGRYSGEMYVMQDHLWLAGDQEAVLHTGLFHGDGSVARDRWRDLLLLTPLYLIACCILGDATGTIVKYFTTQSVSEEPRQAGNTASTGGVEVPLLSMDEIEMENALGEKRRVQQRVWDRICWPRRVGHRAFLVLGVMWVLNMTYYW